MSDQGHGCIRSRWTQLVQQHRHRPGPAPRATQGLGDAGTREVTAGACAKGPPPTSPGTVGTALRAPDSSPGCHGPFPSLRLSLSENWELGEEEQPDTVRNAGTFRAAPGRGRGRKHRGGFPRARGPFGPRALPPCRQAVALPCRPLLQRQTCQHVVCSVSLFCFDFILFFEEEKRNK